MLQITGSPGIPPRSHASFPSRRGVRGPPRAVNTHSRQHIRLATRPLCDSSTGQNNSALLSSGYTPHLPRPHSSSPPPRNIISCSGVPPLDFHFLPPFIAFFLKQKISPLSPEKKCLIQHAGLKANVSGQRATHAADDGHYLWLVAGRSRSHLHRSAHSLKINGAAASSG